MATKKETKEKTGDLGKLQGRTTFPMGGVNQKDLRSLGRNLAKCKNQKEGN